MDVGVERNFVRASVFFGFAALPKMSSVLLTARSDCAGDFAGEEKLIGENKESNGSSLVVFVGVVATSGVFTDGTGAEENKLLSSCAVILLVSFFDGAGVQGQQCQNLTNKHSLGFALGSTATGGFSTC